MKDPDLVSMLTGDVCRLRYVNRYSTCRVLYQESVAEHSYYTTLYALVIASWLIEKGAKVDLGRVAFRGVVHDLEECLIGDIPRPFKYSNEVLKRHIEDAAWLAFQRVVDGLAFSLSFAQTLAKEWKDAKDGSVEGQIVQFADFLSVMSFLLQEVDMNPHITRDHVKSIGPYYRSFLLPEYNTIRPLVLQVEPLVERLVAAEEGRI